MNFGLRVVGKILVEEFKVGKNRVKLEKPKSVGKISERFWCSWKDYSQLERLIEVGKI